MNNSSLNDVIVDLKQDKKMAKIYGFPEGGRAGASATNKRKPGRLSVWFKRTDFTFYLKRYAANALHYPLMAVLLLIMKIRYPVAIVGGGYCLHFLSTHHNALWASGDHSAVYTLLVISAALLSVFAVKMLESATPFHRLFGVYRHKSFSPANDDLID